MADKKEASVARQAYGAASKALRENHKAEFESLLDTAYAELGHVSPRVKAKQRREAAEKARAEAAARRKARQEAKIAYLEAELAALKGEPIPEREAE